MANCQTKCIQGHHWCIFGDVILVGQFLWLSLKWNHIISWRQNAGNRRWNLSEAHAVASQSSHIANGSLDALAFTMMKSYQVGSMILNVSMHAQQSLSLCTEELPTALEIKLSPQRKLPNNRPGFMWPWSASNIQLLAMLNAETRTSLQETSGIGILQSLEFGTVPDSHTCHHAIMSYYWIESQQNHPCLSSQILIQHFLAESRKLSSCQPIYA